MSNIAMGLQVMLYGLIGVFGMLVLTFGAIKLMIYASEKMPTKESKEE